MLKRKERDKMLHNSRICIIISTIVALAICLIAFDASNGGMDMDKGSIVAIIIAIVGLIGSVLGDLIQSKKQGDVTTKVHGDTAEMKPQVKNIEKMSGKIPDDVVEKLAPNIQTISSMSSKVDEIYTEIEHRKRTRYELSTVVQTKEYFVEGIEQLYAKNGQLEGENRALRQQLRKAQEQNQFLSDKLSELSEVNCELNKQLNDQNRDNQQENQAPTLF